MADQDETAVISLAAEQLAVGTRERATGTVRKAEVEVDYTTEAGDRRATPRREPTDG
jgi:hypothetical protein